MTRELFMSELDRKLRVLPYSERQDALEYYEGYLNDANDVDSAILGLGTPGEVAATILAEYVEKAPRKGVRHERRQAGGLRTALVITLALFAVPIGLPLIITVASVSFALILALGSVVFAFGASAAALVIGGIASLVFSPFVMFQNFGAGLIMAGNGLVFLAVAILFVYLTKNIARGFTLIAKFVGGTISRRRAHGAKI